MYTDRIRKKGLVLYLNDGTTSKDILPVEGKEHVFKVKTDEYLEYLLLTDKEANERAEEYIKNRLWTFDTDYIIEHSAVLDFDPASRTLIETLHKQGAAGNDIFLKLIDDIDKFIKDCLSIVGRGHYASMYSSVERSHTFTYKDVEYTLYIYEV